MVDRLTSPNPSPEPAINDPSRRRTEIYMKAAEYEDHIKLRQTAELNLRSIEKRQAEEDKTNEAKTNEKVNELIAANAATQATMAAMAADNENIKALLSQLVQLQAKQTGNSKTATETDTENRATQKTEPKTKLKTEPKTEPQTETETETDTELLTELQSMGVLLHSTQTETYSHDLPVTAPFTEIENANVLNYTDYLQHSDTDQRRTVDFFSLYLHFKANDQGNVIERMEKLHTHSASSTAYKAYTNTLLEELRNFSNPTQHTRLMIFLRALIFSSDITTQQATANMVKVYCATKNADIQALQDHVTRHGSPPYVPGIEAMAKIGGSPGMERLSAMGNPKYFERCLKNMFDMVVECNSRINVQGLDTVAASKAYLATKAGRNYTETKTLEECAWAQLCRVHGNSHPKTDYDRIEFLLSLCADYQGHSKTKRTLLKELHTRGTTITNVL